MFLRQKLLFQHITAVVDVWVAVPYKYRPHSSNSLPGEAERRGARGGARE